MHSVRPCVIVLASLCALRGGAVPQAALAPQEKPLRRRFAAGDEWRYHVRLVVRSELEGPETMRIGTVTYVKMVQHAAEARLGWTIMERVIRLEEDGAANIREQQDAFETLRVSLEPDASDAQAARLGASLRQTLSNWARDRTLEFRMTANGASAQLPSDAAPQMDEPLPPFLTLWLAHALRPAAALPERPVRAGEPWEEPRNVEVSGWTGLHAAETGEWLEAPGSAGNYGALRLHVVQEISGRVSGAAPASTSPAAEAAGGETEHATAERAERFFAESLSTIGLADGRVLAASRSARKEIIHVLAPVPGMKEPPRFRATLSAHVEIEPCVEGQCEASGNH